MSRRAASLATAVVVPSLAVNLLHTVSHAGQHLMPLPRWQLAYVAVVVYAAPAVATFLLWTRHGLAGAWLLAAAMAGSLVFGLLYHFIVPGPDNVFTQPPGTWRATFVVTALLLVPLQVIGSFVGLRASRRIPRPSITAPQKRPSGGLAGSQRGPGSELR